MTDGDPTRDAEALEREADQRSGVDGETHVDLTDRHEDSDEEPHLREIREAAMEAVRQRVAAIREIADDDEILTARADQLEEGMVQVGEEAAIAYRERNSNLDPATNPELAELLDKKEGELNEEYAPQRSELARSHEEQRAALEVKIKAETEALDGEITEHTARALAEEIEEYRVNKLTPVERQAEENRRIILEMVAKEKRLQAWAETYLEKAGSLKNGEAGKLGEFTVAYGFGSESGGGGHKEGTPEYEQSLAEDRDRFNYLLKHLGIDVTAAELVDAYKVYGLKRSKKRYEEDKTRSDDLAEVNTLLDELKEADDTLIAGERNYQVRTKVLRGDKVSIQLSYSYNMDGGTTKLNTAIIKHDPEAPAFESKLIEELPEFGEDELLEKADYMHILRLAEKRIEEIENPGQASGQRVPDFLSDNKKSYRIPLEKARGLLKGIVDRMGIRPVEDGISLEEAIANEITRHPTDSIRIDVVTKYGDIDTRPGYNDRLAFYRDTDGQLYLDHLSYKVNKVPEALQPA